MAWESWMPPYIRELVWYNFAHSHPLLHINDISSSQISYGNCGLSALIHAEASFVLPAEWTL